MPSSVAKWFGDSKRLCLIILLALFLVIAPVVALNVLNPGGAEAHVSPANANTPSVSISITAYTVPGNNIIPPATVTQGDEVQYRITLSFGSLVGLQVGYDFQSGEITATLPDGTVVQVAGFGAATPAAPVVPLVTAATPFVVDVPVLYTVDLADRDGSGFLWVYANYGAGQGVHPENGYFHNTVGDPAMEHARTASATTANAFAPVAEQSLVIDKYNDLDGDGSWDVGEPYLPGWHFDVTGPQNFLDQVTDVNGQIILNSIATGDYTITETSLLGGWVHTDPDSPPYQKVVTVNTDQITEVKFGNQVVERHPPSVPVIGTWGAGLMAAAFAGALIWVLALRRRRPTV